MRKTIKEMTADEIRREIDKNEYYMESIFLEAKETGADLSVPWMDLVAEQERLQRRLFNLEVSGAEVIG